MKQRWFQIRAVTTRFTSLLMVVAFSSHARILREGLTNHCPPTFFSCLQWKSLITRLLIRHMLFFPCGCQNSIKSYTVPQHPFFFFFFFFFHLFYMYIKWDFFMWEIHHFPWRKPVIAKSCHLDYILSNKRKVPTTLNLGLLRDCKTDFINFGNHPSIQKWFAHQMC